MSVADQPDMIQASRRFKVMNASKMATDTIFRSPYSLGEIVMLRFNQSGNIVVSSYADADIIPLHSLEKNASFSSFSCHL